MSKIVTFLALLIASSTLFAAPVLFTAAEYSVDVLAGVDADITDDSATLGSPPTDPAGLPVLVSVTQEGVAAGDDATADALVDNVLGELLLSTSTEAAAESTNAAFVDASATSSLFATFAGAGLYTLVLDFESFDESLVSGINEAGAELFVRIDVGFDTLLDRTLSIDELVLFEFVLPDAVEGVLDVLLVSHAFAETGRAANLATAALTFDVEAVVNNVSEVPTLALVLGSLLMVAAPFRVQGRINPRAARAS